MKTEIVRGRKAGVGTREHVEFSARSLGQRLKSMHRPAVCLEIDKDEPKAVPDVVLQNVHQKDALPESALPQDMNVVIELA